MSTKYIKVAVTERLPIENGTYITSHGWNYWNGNKFEDESDKEIHYINYWFEEVPDNEADLRKENEEMKAMLEEINRRYYILATEPNGIVRETMIDNLTDGISELIQKHKQ